MKFGSVSEMKFYCTRVMHIVYWCLCATAAEMTNCNKPHVAHRAEIVYYWPLMKKFAAPWSKPKMHSAWLLLRRVRRVSELT